MTRRLAVLLVLLAACSGGGDHNNGNGGNQGPTPINMDQVLDAFVAANSNVPSVAMIAVKDGQVIYSHTAGFADAARTRAPSEATLYKTSSIAKLVIAVAVMQQVELGLIDLDADASNYLPFTLRDPDFPNTIITVRMLMQHNAGLALPDFGEVTDNLFEAFDASTIVSLQPLIEAILTPGDPEYRDSIWLSGGPGSVSINSNIGMVLLAFMVEELSGLHFNDYAKFNIFEPLGMDRTSLYYPDLDANEVAALYDDANNVAEQLIGWFYPIGGLFTCTGDWAKFLSAMLAGGIYNGNRILAEASVDAMLGTTTPVNNQLAYQSKIGLIWREAAANPGWYGHTGAGTQMTHVTEINPVRNIGYVLFTNEGRIDSLVGPGSVLNRSIHSWLSQLD